MKRIAIPAFFAVLIFLTGCGGSGVFSNFREVGSMELIRVMGVDYEDGTVTVTGVSSGENRSVHSVSAAGIAEAVSEFERSSYNGNADFSHADNVVISRSAAENIAAPLLDYITRDMKMRMDTGLFILSEGKVCDTLTVESTEELESVVKNAASLGLGSYISCLDISYGLAKNGVSLVEAVSSDGGLLPRGYGILIDGRLFGILSEEESFYVSMIRNDLEGGFFYAEGDGGRVSFNISRSRVTFRDGVLAADVLLNVSGISGGTDINSEAVRLKLEEQLEAQIKSGILAAVSDCEKTGRDYLGLSGSPTEVTAGAEIIRTYDLSVPENTSGEGKNG